MLGLPLRPNWKISFTVCRYNLLQRTTTTNTNKQEKDVEYFPALNYGQMNEHENNNKTSRVENREGKNIVNKRYAWNVWEAWFHGHLFFLFLISCLFFSSSHPSFLFLCPFSSSHRNVIQHGCLSQATCHALLAHPSLSNMNESRGIVDE